MDRAISLAGTLVRRDNPGIPWNYNELPRETE